MKQWVRAALLFVCLVVGSVFPGRPTTGLQPGLPPTGDSLLDLAPVSSLVAVELRDLDRRWGEVRSIGAIAGLQDLLLSGVGIDSDRVSILAGERSLFLLVPAPEVPFFMPVILLRPVDTREAMRVLDKARNIHYCSGRDALWVGPAAAADSINRMASSADPGLRSILPMDEIETRLPPGGIARGYIQPRAWMDLIGRLAARTNLQLSQLAASWLGAELSAVRYIAFRRELRDGEIATEAMAAYDLAGLPAEVARIFNAGKRPVHDLPMPAGAIAGISFRPESRAWLPWLRYLAVRDRHGPMRNLGFLLDEFQQRYHRDLQRDLCNAIGEQGWLFLLAGEQAGHAHAVVIVETKSGADLEASMADLLEWVGEQLWMESLGALWPRSWSRSGNGTENFGLDFWTPLGQRTCLACARAGRYLVLGDNDASLNYGLDLARTLNGIEALEVPDTQMTVRINGSEISRLFDVPMALRARPANPFIDSIARLLADFEGARLDLQYERDAVRLKGYARFRVRP